MQVERPWPDDNGSSGVVGCTLLQEDATGNAVLKLDWRGGQGFGLVISVI